MLLNKTKLVILGAILILGSSCSEEEKTANVAAKVNESVLTEDEIKNTLDKKAYSAKTREEFINDWIEKEILFQEAVSDDITSSDEYNFLIEKNRKEIAVGLLIKKLLQENNVSISEEELKNYFEQNKEDFRLMDDVYRFNEIHFSNFDLAVKFRNILVESGWDKAVNVFRGENSLVRNSVGILRYKYQLQPVSFLRILDNLEPLETSIVFETRQDNYCIVQLLELYKKGTDTNFDIIKDEVKERYVIVKNREFIREYINNLLKDNNLEVMRYNE